MYDCQEIRKCSFPNSYYKGNLTLCDVTPPLIIELLEKKVTWTVIFSLIQHKDSTGGRTVLTEEEKEATRRGKMRDLEFQTES
jgi:hypothetical protein